MDKHFFQRGVVPRASVLLDLQLDPTSTLKDKMGFARPPLRTANSALLPPALPS